MVPNEYISIYTNFRGCSVKCPLKFDVLMKHPISDEYRCIYADFMRIMSQNAPIITDNFMPVSNEYRNMYTDFTGQMPPPEKWTAS